MNVADLTAKIKVVLEKDDLSKLSESLENVKKKIQELNKKLQDLSEEQKETAEQTEKVADQSEEAAKVTEKQADSTEKLADKTKKATSELHGFAGLLSRIVEFMKQLVITGAASGVVLERMYEKAGRLGASLRLISTDFSLSPQALQQWQMLAEQAGLSSDTMDRMLSVATEMKRLAIVNPNYLPRSLNLAGIRPANFSDPESLLKAILQTSLSSGFKNDQARMAWLKDAGFNDPAAAFLLAKQFAKGNKLDSAYFISDENVEKLKNVNIAIDKIDRLSESIKNNFLATISGDFVSQINSICEYVIRAVHAVEDFITRHGGFKKVLADLGGLASKTSKIVNGFASLSKFVMQFGLFTSLVLGFGVVLGGVLKIVDWLVAKFTTTLELAGSLKELIAGFVSIKVGEAIEAGKITGEYVGEALDLKNKLSASAGVYKEPSQVEKGIRSILTWLKDTGSKIKSTLFNVLSNAIFKGIDYLIDSLLRLWLDLDLPFSSKARSLLVQKAMQIPEELRSEQQKDLIEEERNKVRQEHADISNYGWGMQLFHTQDELDKFTRNKYFNVLRNIFENGTISGSDAYSAALKLTDLSKPDVIKTMTEKQQNLIANVNAHFNFTGKETTEQMEQKILKQCEDGTCRGLMSASGLGG